MENWSRATIVFGIKKAVLVNLLENIGQRIVIIRFILAFAFDIFLRQQRFAERKGKFQLQRDAKDGLLFEVAIIQYSE
jgi:hypothetical protein